MAKIKITGRRAEPYMENRTQRQKRRGLPGHCRRCGAVLKDPKSIQAGYGHRCNLQTPVVVVLEIPAGDTQ